MEPLKLLSGLACPLPLANLDTDQIVPARFMKQPRSAGYGQFLLHDLRHDAEGNARPDFILNRPDAEGARTLVARRNFGAGSSREAAVYALVDFGFRCVVASSFGDIFSANAVNNGLLPATVEEADLESLFDYLGDQPAPLKVDLERCRLRAGEREIAFTVNPVWRTKLINGWDDIGMTQRHRAAIDDFAAERLRVFPWVSPVRPALPREA
ncbi:3-isopropylmalate dehydratase small subunit [Algihabitans albus]|uniref:3-isopropylmalate dehydratase small subunit n=1 Tax=Algihabitans albus TaxID=2164067 RepID=UPI000E5D5449|nr:3-isopropylmalate dehydratase small subunit [Algihabitans albus]